MVAKTRRRNNFIIGAALIFLLAVAPLGYNILQRNDDSGGGMIESYNGFEFARMGGMWKLVLEEMDFYFTYLPQEVENVSVIGFYSFSDYVAKPLYFIDSNVVAQEILVNLQNTIERTQDACLNETLCVGDLPVKNCSDNLIIFKEGNMTRVSKNDGCVTISGNWIKGSDAFLYKILGVG